MGNIPGYIQHLGTVIATALLAGIGMNQLAVQPQAARATAAVVRADTAVLTERAADIFGAEQYDKWRVCSNDLSICEAKLRACRDSR